MTNWIIDERGNQTFTHAGWVVRIWSPESAWNRINVESPNRGEEVEVTEEGIWVNGESWWMGRSCPNAFTIPWPVIGAIIEARQIVG